MVYTDISKERTEFDRNDMLNPGDVAETILDIAKRPLHVRIDEVNVLPPKGVL
jgi:NADP-dependent 3-hydroxy acid dehydrogenase YdfG